MNSLHKGLVSLVSIAAVSLLAGCSASPFLSADPSLAEVTASVNQQIAADLHYEMAKALKQPHIDSAAVRVASVEVNEVAGSVLVEASRLPAAEPFTELTAQQGAAF